MVVPDLPIDVKLDEANPALDKTPGHQATSSVRVCWLFPNAVHLQCGWTFLGQIQGAAGLELQLGCQLITRDTGIQLKLVGATSLVYLIQFGDEVAFGRDRLRRPGCIRIQIQDR